MRCRGTRKTSEVGQVLFHGSPPALVVKQTRVVERRTAEAVECGAAALGALDDLPTKELIGARGRVAPIAVILHGPHVLELQGHESPDRLALVHGEVE